MQNVFAYRIDTFFMYLHVRYACIHDRVRRSVFTGRPPGPEMKPYSSAAGLALDSVLLQGADGIDLPAIILITLLYG